MFDGSWPAGWRYAFSDHTEDDIIEHYGSARPNDNHSTVHSRHGTPNDFTYNDEQRVNMTVPLDQDYHTYTRIHKRGSGFYYSYLDGEYISRNPIDFELDNTPQYLLINFAIYSPVFIPANADPIIDAQDDRSKLRCDHVRVMQLS